MTIFPQKFLNARKCHEMVRNSYDFYSARFLIDFVRFSNIFWQFSGRETRIFTKSFPKLGSAQKWCEIHMISILYKISMNFVWFFKVYGFVGDNNCILQLFVLNFSINLAFTPPSAGLLRNLRLRCPFILLFKPIPNTNQTNTNKGTAQSKIAQKARRRRGEDRIDQFSKTD